MRRSVAVFCWLIIFPFTASALGLGEISLNSALNQPFAAQIPVESYTDADVKELKVALASKATFERYGLDRPVFLQDFEFSITESAGGAPVVAIRSNRPVSEPFVTLLLDIQWSSGRLLREYTVLLDPPLFESEPVEAAVTTPAASGADTRVEQSESSGEVVRATEPARTPAPATASQPARVTPAPAPVSRPAPAPLTGSYSVQRRDTLWGIANRVRGDRDVTVNQVMLALYRANPDAFLGNINRLKAGAILRMPADAELGELTPQQATSVVREQNAALTQPAPEPARLTLVAPDAEPDTTDTAAAEPGSAADAERALEQAARGVEADQLRGRIGELETELADSRRLIEARDAELAALQRRIQVLESRDDATEGLTDDGVFVDTEVETEAPGDAAVADDPLFADEAAEPAVADAEPEAAADPTTSVPARTEEPSFFAELLGNLWFWVSAAVVLLLALFLARRRQGETDDKFDAGVSGEDWAAAPAAADHEETLRDLEPIAEPQNSIVVEETPASAEPDVAAGDGTAQLENLLDFGDEAGEEAGDAVSDDTLAEPQIDVGETSQLEPADDADIEEPLEKTISTGPLNLDKADPVAEAEFHMAYGLYDQAAELLEAALEKEPQNRGYLVKLIEVYFVWENRDGFLKHATALREQIGDDGDSDWSKVVILGKQLCPDEEIFSGAATALPTADAMDFELSDATDDGDGADLDFTIAGADAPALSEDEVADDDADLDFDLGAEFGADESDDIALDLGEDEPAEVEGGDTVETPTIESPAVSHGDDDLIDDDASTMETPTVEAPLEEPTLESPPLEFGGNAGETTEMPELDSESFDAGDIDLDLGGADDLDVDLTGLNEDGSDKDDETLLADVGDEAEDDDPDGDNETLLADFGDEAEDDDPDGDNETLVADSGDLEAEIEAELNAQSTESSDTVEQPKIDPAEVELGDTAEQPVIADAGDVDFDFGMEAEADDDVATAVEEASLPEDATMTEVGTKLDLARAYIDMGDPDGARSILNEVLDEGADEQQQEARQLLEELGD